MRYGSLPGIDKSVSAICLGTLQCGWWVDEDRSRVILGRFFGVGGNFVDTADCYPTFPDGTGGERSEEIIGRWLKARGRRHDIVLATKVGGRVRDVDGEGLSAARIVKAVEGSLRRLQTDYIDLYQAHDDDLTVPQDEALAAFDQLVRRGLVVAIGCSNFSTDRLASALKAGMHAGLGKYCSIQLHLSLLERSYFDRSMRDLCTREQVAVLPYMGLGKGFLTGRYAINRPAPRTPRAPGIARLYETPNSWSILERVLQVARGRSVAPAQVAIAWLLHQPGVFAPVIGASEPEHVTDFSAATELRLSADELDALDEKERE